MATKKSSSSTKGRGKVKKVMHEYKHGELKSGGKKKVKSRKQAVAIALRDTRQRDTEFDARGGVSKEDLVARLRATVEDAAATLAKVSAERLAERIVVQKYDLPVLEAIAHVVEHFSMHTGQIIFATKMMTS